MAPERPPTLGLVLPGGGARGAYQVGVLKAIAELLPGPNNPFPVVVGTSVGAINAVSLAAGSEDFGNAVRALTRLWQNLKTDDIYRIDSASVMLNGLHWLIAMTPVAALGVPSPRSLLDNTPLWQFLETNIDFTAIGRAIRKGALKAVSVSASSYDRGRAMTFFEAEAGIPGWSRARRDGEPTLLSIEHLMAATALPFIFPAVQIGNEHFGDGSLRQTSPLSPAIHTGADRILVITCRDQIPDPAPSAAEVTYPSLGEISGTMLDIIFLDNLDADIERTRRIDHTVSLIAPEHAAETSLRQIDVLTIEPSRDVRDVAGEYADAMPWTIKMLLHRLGIWGRDWRLVSYLMFEPPYCNALIELGYRDTLARSDEVLRFLTA